MMNNVVRSLRRVSTRGFATAQMEQMPVTYGVMKASKHDFVHFVNTAMKDRSSKEAKELFRYLNKCFIDNDTDYDGLISYRGFNAMIAEAAAAPRRFGFAPHQREMYKSQEEYDLARTELFNELKDAGTKRVNQESWVRWAMAHIQDKVGGGLAEHDLCKWERSKEECVEFFKLVSKQGSHHNTKTTSSTQYKEFYMLMNEMFIKNESSMTGKMSKVDFDKLVKECNTIPKKFGMDWFKNVSYDACKQDGILGWKQFLQMSLEIVKKGAASA